MTVAELIDALQALDPALDVRLEASFDGMRGSGQLAQVSPDECNGRSVVVLRDDEMAFDD